MNLKYYLRGLGSGIIIATSVLAITYAITNRDANIIQKARELGMVFSEETKENQTNEQPNTDKNNPSTSEEKTSGEEVTSDETTTEEATTEETTTEEVTKVQEETTTVESTYTITIKRGMTSESVAMIFKNFGVIDDQEAFNSYLVDNGYANYIRIGVYEVVKGDSYENLAKIITGTY